MTDAPKHPAEPDPATELASAAHITLFTASRILNEWQRRRAIVKRRGHVVLRAPERLAITID